MQAKTKEETVSLPCKSETRALAMGVFFAYRGASLPKVAALCCGTVLLLELVL